MDKLQLTKQVMDQANTVVAIMDIEALRDNFIETYNRATRTNEGSMKFEAEKSLFVQAAAANKKIDECDPFTKYNAFMELCTSGLSLRDGLSYMVPMKNVLVWMPGWRGRLEQLQEIPEVQFCYEPEVVYECDEFKYSKGQGGIKVIAHVPNESRTDADKITHVYFPVQMHNGNLITYHMMAQDVYKTRAKSPSYKDYVKTLNNDKNKKAGKVHGDVLLGSYRDSRTNEWKDFPIDPPMWISDEAQAFKKTIVKRTYMTFPNKLKKHKDIDASVAEKVAQSGVNDPVIDAEDAPIAGQDQPINDGNDPRYTDFEEIKTEKPSNRDISDEDTEGDSF